MIADALSSQPALTQGPPADEGAAACFQFQELWRSLCAAPYTSSPVAASSSQDAWEAYVKENWAPALRSAFGQHWKEHFRSEVAAMLHLSMQQACLASPVLFPLPSPASPAGLPALDPALYAGAPLTVTGLPVGPPHSSSSPGSCHPEAAMRPPSPGGSTDAVQRRGGLAMALAPLQDQQPAEGRPAYSRAGPAADGRPCAEPGRKRSAALAGAGAPEADATASDARDTPRRGGVVRPFPVPASDSSSGSDWEASEAWASSSSAAGTPPGAACSGAFMALRPRRPVRIVRAPKPCADAATAIPIPTQPPAGTRDDPGGTSFPLERPAAHALPARQSPVDSSPRPCGGAISPRRSRNKRAAPGFKLDDGGGGITVVSAPLPVAEAPARPSSARSAPLAGWTCGHTGRLFCSCDGHHGSSDGEAEEDSPPAASLPPRPASLPAARADPASLLCPPLPASPPAMTCPAPSASSAARTPSPGMPAPTPGRSPGVAGTLPPGPAGIFANGLPLPLVLCRSLLDGVDCFGRTPLHIAAAAGRVDVVRHLLYAGADASKWLPVDYRLLHQPMGDAGAPLPSVPALAGEPSAAYRASPASATQPGALPVGSAGGAGLRGLSIPPVSLQYCSALHLAAFHGHAEVVEALLAASACDVQSPNVQGCTALHVAAHEGHAEVVKLLARASGAALDAPDMAGRSPLHYAAARGRSAAVMELWAASCNIEPVDALGWTALHYAAEAGHTEVVSQLVIAGCHVQRGDAAGLTAAHLAARGGHAPALDKLLLAGYEVDALGAGASALHLAAAHGHTQMVQKLLSAGANPRLLNAQGAEALACAAAGGHVEIVNALLEAGCSPHAHDAAGVSVLHAAAQGRAWPIMARLLELGCEKSALTSQGRSILHHAALGGSEEVVQRLLDLGADACQADADGCTPWHAAVQSGSTALVARLLAAGCDIEAPNATGCTALHFAARSGSLPVVELLLECGARVEARCAIGAAALHHAAEGGATPVLERLLRGAPPELVNQGDARGWTPLHCAARLGSPADARLLLQAGAQPNLQTSDGWTALHLAARQRGAGVAQQLLAAGADGSLLDARGCAPLHYAAQAANLELFNALFASPSSCVTGPDAKGYTALHYAVEGGSLDIVGVLLYNSGGPGLTADPPPRPCTPAGSTAGDAEPTPVPLTPQPAFTPLHLAAQRGHVELVAYLLKAGYAVDQPDPAGRTPLHCAALAGRRSRGRDIEGQGPGTGGSAVASVGQSGGLHAAAAEVLLSAGADPHVVDNEGVAIIHMAAGGGSHALLDRLLGEGVEPDGCDDAGWTPLFWAAAAGHTACAARLVAADADLGALDEAGRLPLHHAAEAGRTDCVALLVVAMVDQGLDVNAPDDAGATAAALAAAGGHRDAVARILDNGTGAVERGMSALHLAVQGGHEELVRQLLALPGTAFDQRDGDGLTALHWAASKGSATMVDQLLAAGCEVDAPTNDAWTALHEAASNGHTSIVQRLLAAGAQINLKTANGSTALHNAAAGGHNAIVDELLVAGAPANARALSGAAPLYGAATGGHATVIKQLLSAGADVHAAATTGGTALHTAASGGHAEAVDALIAARADVDAQAQNGATALHNAASGGHLAVTLALLAAKADADIQNSNGNTALHLAASRGHLEVVEALVAAGADAHIRNSKAWAAVHSAAAAGQLEAVLRLVAAGAAPRARPELDVLRLLTRKTSYKHSYVEGRLRLAEKERQRIKGRTSAVGGLGATAASGAIAPGAGPSDEELAAQEARANAVMASLLQEEAARKELEAKKRVKKKEKKKKKAGERKAEAEASEATSDAGAEGGEAATPDAAAKATRAPSEADAAEGTSASSRHGDSPPSEPAEQPKPSRPPDEDAASGSSPAEGEGRPPRRAPTEGTAAAGKSPTAQRGGKIQGREAVSELRVPAKLSMAGAGGRGGAANDRLDHASGVSPTGRAGTHDRAGQGTEARAAHATPGRPGAADAGRDRGQRGGAGKLKGLRTPPRADASNTGQAKGGASGGRGGAHAGAEEASEGRRSRQRRPRDRQREAPEVSDFAPAKAPAPQPAPQRPAGRGAGRIAASSLRAPAQLETQPAPPPREPCTARPTAAGLSFAAVARGQVRGAPTVAPATASAPRAAGLRPAAGVDNPAAAAAGLSAQDTPAGPAQGPQRQLVFRPQGEASRLQAAPATQPLPLPLPLLPSAPAPVAPSGARVGRQPPTQPSCAHTQPVLSSVQADGQDPAGQLPSQPQSALGVSVPIPVPAPQPNLALHGTPGGPLSLEAIPRPYVGARPHVLSAAAPAWLGPPRHSAAATGLLGSSPGPAEPRALPGFLAQRAIGREAPCSGLPGIEGVPTPPSGPQQPGTVATRPAAWRQVDAVDWSFGGAGRGSPFSRTTSATSLPGLAPRRETGDTVANGERAEAAPGPAQSSLGSDSGTSEWSLGLGMAADGIAAGGGIALHAPVPDVARRSFGSDGPGTAGGGPGFASLLHSIWNNGPQAPGAAPLPAPHETARRTAAAASAAASWAPAKPAQLGTTRTHTVRQMAEIYGLACPITKELMQDPVVASDGYTYEREAIQKLLASPGQAESPITHAPLPHKDLVPNLTMRSAIGLLIPKN